MVRFITTYSIVAVTGSLLVFFSVPLMKQPSLPARQTQARKTVTADQKKELELRKQREAEAIAAAEKEAAEAPDIERAPADKEEEKKPRIPSLKKYYNTAKGYIKKKEWDTAIKVLDQGLEHYPDHQNLLSLKKQASNRGKKWAVVWRDNTPIYSQQGKHIRKLPQGTFLQIKTDKTTASGILYIADVSIDGTTEKDILIKPELITTIDGSLDQASEETKALAAKKASLKSKIYQMERDLKKKLDEQNPHNAKYQKARKEYSEFSAKVRSLLAKRDEASGEDRVRMSDELRQMQPDSLRLKQEYEAAKRDYDKYKKQNSSIGASPELQQLQDDYQSISKKITKSASEG